ncbi:MAG: hypothetical protein HC804_07200 [Anaerolineae bacterium]|nr:hypothetical protein [Anaerolineae bacterium]
MVRYEQSQPTGTMIIADPFYELIDAESLARTAVTMTDARWIQAGSDVAGAMVFVGDGDGRLYVPEYAPLSPVLRQLLRLPDTPNYHSQTPPTFDLYALPSLPEMELLAEPVTFADKITLEGYELLPTNSSSTVTLLTRWLVQQPLPPHLTIFVHLLNANGEIVAQYDGFDAAPTALRTGDRLIQLHPLALPAQEGPFKLQMGLYTPADGQRLTHSGSPAELLILATDLHFDEK